MMDLKGCCRIGIPHRHHSQTLPQIRYPPDSPPLPSKKKQGAETRNVATDIESFGFSDSSRHLVPCPASPFRPLSVSSVLQQVCHLPRRRGQHLGRRNHNISHFRTAPATFGGTPRRHSAHSSVRYQTDTTCSPAQENNIMPILFGARITSESAAERREIERRTASMVSARRRESDCRSEHCRIWKEIISKGTCLMNPSSKNGLKTDIAGLNGKKRRAAESPQLA